MKLVNPKATYTKSGLTREEANIVRRDKKETFLKYLELNFGNVTFTLREHRLEKMQGKRIEEPELPVSSGTIRNWKEDDKEFAKDVDKITNRGIVKKDLLEYLEGNFIKQIEKGNPVLLMFGLVNLSRDTGKWKHRSEINVSGKVAHLTYSDALRMLDQKAKGVIEDPEKKKRDKEKSPKKKNKIIEGEIIKNESRPTTKPNNSKE